MLGPIDAAITQFLMYVPLQVDGLTLFTKSTIAWMFSANFSVSNETLPAIICKLASLSVRYSTLPALISLIAAAMFGDTVPVFESYGKSSQDYYRKKQQHHSRNSG